MKTAVVRPQPLKNYVDADPDSLSIQQLHKGIAALRNYIQLISKDLDEMIQKQIHRPKPVEPKESPQQTLKKDLQRSRAYNERLLNQISVLEKRTQVNVYQKIEEVDREMEITSAEIAKLKNQLRQIERQRQKVQKPAQQQPNHTLLKQLTNEKKKNQELKCKLKKLEEKTKSIPDKLDKQTVILKEKEIRDKLSAIKQKQQLEQRLKLKQDHLNTLKGNYSSKIKLQQQQIKRLRKKLQELSCEQSESKEKGRIWRLQKENQ